MKIKKGIMLHHQSSEDYELIKINSGVTHYTKQDTGKVIYEDLSFLPSYEEDAFTPKKNWRVLSAQEIKTLKSTDKRSDSNTIYIGDIPENLRNSFQKLNLAQCKNRNDVFAKFKANPEATLEINQATEEFLKSKADGKPFRFHYLGTNLPNLEVVACDTTVLPADHTEEDKKYMGIHNDGTKFVSPHALYKSGNRLTINLGKETRSFLFINLTMTQALNMLKQKIDTKKHPVDIINISKYFFEHFPDYPVIKIDQKPYQYYIAPTDNCFHDGSTLGMKGLDIIIVYFGAFRF